MRDRMRTRFGVTRSQWIAALGGIAIVGVGLPALMMSRRGRVALDHLSALVSIAFAVRSATVMRGWVRVPPAAPDPDAPLVSIIVPARNEERAIQRCVRSLLAQTANFELIVVDDDSADRTGLILAEVVREHPTLRVVKGEPLPAGWTGKPWALAQGARLARGAWLLFTDADTWHAPESCASVLAFARERQVDAVTLWAHQELGSLAERLNLPAILTMVLLGSGTIRQLNDPGDRKHGLANGQFIFVSRLAYNALGGHAALRNEILDDIMFARRLKADSRFRLVLADGRRMVRVRMYTSLRELWGGFTKNIYLGARDDLRILVGAPALLALLSVIPAALAVQGFAARRPVRVIEAILSLGCGIAGTSRILREVGIPIQLSWYAPIGFVTCGAIMLTSTINILSGRGVEWRGRRYAGNATLDSTGDGGRSEILPSSLHVQLGQRDDPSKFVS